MSQPGAMAGQNVLDDRQAETRAAMVTAGLDIDPVEALGQPRQMLLGDARPEIADREPTVRRLAAGSKVTSTLPPDWPYLQAFSIRFSKT